MTIKICHSEYVIKLFLDTFFKILLNDLIFKKIKKNSAEIFKYCNFKLFKQILCLESYSQNIEGAEYVTELFETKF